MEQQISELEQMLKQYRSRRRSMASIGKSLAHLAHCAEQAQLLPEQRARLAETFNGSISSHA